MYDIKSTREFKGKNNNIRTDCICDRSYFTKIQNSSMFELKSIYIPIEVIIK